MKLILIYKNKGLVVDKEVDSVTGKIDDEGRAVLKLNYDDYPFHSNTVYNFLGSEQ